MKANEKDDCGHSCFDAECQGEADPLCPVHGMTPDEVYEAAKRAAEGATVAAGGWCAPSVESPAEARERWKEMMFHEHYGLSGRDGDMSLVVYPPDDNPWERSRRDAEAFVGEHTEQLPEFTAGLVHDAVQAMRDAPRGHWEWRMDPPDNATRQLGQWTWVED